MFLVYFVSLRKADVNYMGFAESICSWVETRVKIIKCKYDLQILQKYVAVFLKTG